MANQATDVSGTVQLGRYKVPSQVLAALHAAAPGKQAFEALLTNAAVESGFRTDVKASSSSASGLFQFIDQTWLAAVKKSGAAHGLGAQAAAIVQRGGRYAVEDPAMRQEILGLRNDPKVAAAIAGDHLKDLTSTLTASIGHAPSAAETYLGHFLGPGGASQMLRALASNPNASAASVLPDAARANPALFSGRTVGEFVGKIESRVAQTYSELGLAQPSGGLKFDAASGGGVADSAATAQVTDSDGWGQGGPSKLSTTPERVMLDSLARVFTRMDRKLTGEKAKAEEGTPDAAVQTLNSASATSL